MTVRDERTQVRGLAAVVRVLGRSSDLPTMLEAAADEALRAIDAASVSVSVLESGTAWVRTLVNVGELGPREERLPSDERYPVEDFAHLGAVLGDQRTVVQDILDPQCGPAERQLLVDLGKGCSISAPVVVDGRLWGVFFATRHLGTPVFGEREAAYLEALVAILASAVSRGLREESLERLAYEDPLTGLANRRALDDGLAQAFVTAPGTLRHVTVVTADLNKL
ncbi:MAG: GAF domain-containing protein [Nocardioides sp.]